MKKLFLTVLISAVFACIGFAQDSLSAVRLNAGTEVANTVFWKNSKAKSVSSGVLPNNSAADSEALKGEDNILLRNMPFENGYRIHPSSPAYNAGKAVMLPAMADSLDLDYHLRVNCFRIDMGAYEYVTVPTEITMQPIPQHVCEGSPAVLQVSAAGTHITYQWQRDGIDLIGKTSAQLTLAGHLSDTGTYRVIAIGDCCNDTSVSVRVDIDLNPSGKLVVMNDTTVASGESVLLTVISAVGAVTWYENDYVTEVSDPLIANITEIRQYIAIARNGVCSTDASAEVHIFVEDVECVLKTRSDTVLCLGDSCRLLMDSAQVEYKWYNLRTGLEVPNHAMICPDTTTLFVAAGSNAKGDVCSDTLTVTIHKVDFEVMKDETVCGQLGGTEVDLESMPFADWYLESGHYIGFGNTRLHVLNNTTNHFIARYSDDLCTVEKRVKITSNPPNLKVLFADTTICRGDSIKLISNADPNLITWKEKVSGIVLPFAAAAHGPMVSPLVTTVYEVWTYDHVCGDVFDKVTVAVQQRPNFNIETSAVLCAGSSTTLLALPNASYWTLLNGTRIFNPIAPSEPTAYIGWYASGACLVSDTLHLSIETPPESFTARPDTTIEQGSPIELWSVPDATRWIRLPATLLSSGTCTVFPTDSVTLFIAELETESCGIFYDTVCVYATPPMDTLYVNVLSGSGCFDGDGWAMANVIGTTGPYTYLWSNGATDSITEGLPSGDHSVSVTDKNGRIVVASFTIGHTDSLQILYLAEEPDNKDCNNGRIEISVSGGTPEYEYTWNHGSIASNLNGAEAGTYTLTVTDAKGCEKTTEIVLPCLYKRVMPTIFITPNGDGKNDFVTISHIEYYPRNRVIILNSYGDEVNHFNNYNNTTVKWDGRNQKDEVLPDGVYYYVVEAEGLEPMAGWIYMKLSKMK